MKIKQKLWIFNISRWEICSYSRIFMNHRNYESWEHSLEGKFEVAKMFPTFSLKIDNIPKSKISHF